MHIYYQYFLQHNLCVCLHILLSFMSLLVKHQSLWQFTRTCLRALAFPVHAGVLVPVSGILRSKKSFKFVLTSEILERKVQWGDLIYSRQSGMWKSYLFVFSVKQR